MKVLKFGLLICVQYFLIGCAVFEKNTVPSDCSIKTYSNYSKIISDNPDKIPFLLPLNISYTGYSLLPFGSRDQSKVNAEIKACESRYSDFYVSLDTEQSLHSGNVPKGYFVGGTYQVYSIKGFRSVRITERVVLEQMKAWFSTPAVNVYRNEHLSHLMSISKDNKYSNISIEIERIVKNQVRIDLGSRIYTELLSNYVFHEGRASKSKLISWAKYHENKNIRYAAYLNLIDAGMRSSVETILDREPDEYVKRSVSRKLI